MTQNHLLTDEARAGLRNITPPTFWALVFMMWMLGQIPVIGMPFRFLGTWVHELGHGLGAIISGGSFEKFHVFPNFSGLAITHTSTPFQRFMTLVTGLLGPAIAGGFMLILARGYGRSRLVIAFLAVALLLSGLLWSADMFTGTVLLALAALFGLIAVKGSSTANYVTAHIVAIAFCLNAVASIGYFFSPGGDVGGSTYQSDAAHLTQLLGGFQWMWGVLLTATSLLIMYGALRLSGLIRKAN